MPKHLFAAIRRQRAPLRVAPIVVEASAWAREILHRRLGSRPTDLTADEAAGQLAEYGPSRLRVRLVRADVEQGYIDFKRGGAAAA